MPAEQAEQMKAREKAYAADLQSAEEWVHQWRVVGEYANYSVFDIESNDELRRILSDLPLFPNMTIEVKPLARHPSSLKERL